MLLDLFRRKLAPPAVVASDVPAGRIYFTEGGGGFVLPPGSPERSLFSAEPDPQQFPMPRNTTREGV